jgi:hypothetical protein
MKKTIFILSLFISSLSYAQWAGSSNTGGNIHRNGNVGIATTNPQNRLQIGNAFSFHDGGHEVIGFGVAPGSTASDLDPLKFSSELRLDPANGHFCFGISPSIDSSPITRMVLHNNGNVGIGTYNPSEKLTVNGKILCEEIEVIQNVTPDYVFQKYYTGNSILKNDYKMLSLEEIEAFTKANHHLPNVPSSEDIKENGLQLKEMTNILLEKIEELTLYTIEQEKRIKALEAKLSKKN